MNDIMCTEARNTLSKLVYTDTAFINRKYVGHAPRWLATSSVSSRQRARFAVTSLSPPDGLQYCKVRGLTYCRQSCSLETRVNEERGPQLTRQIAQR